MGPGAPSMHHYRAPSMGHPIAPPTFHKVIPSMPSKPYSHHQHVPAHHKPMIPSKPSDYHQVPVHKPPTKPASYHVPPSQYEKPEMPKYEEGGLDWNSYLPKPHPKPEPDNGGGENGGEEPEKDCVSQADFNAFVLSTGNTISGLTDQINNLSSGPVFDYFNVGAGGPIPSG